MQRNLRENTPAVRGGPSKPELYLCKLCRVSLTTSLVLPCFTCKMNGGKPKSKKNIGFWLKEKE